MESVVSKVKAQLKSICDQVIFVNAYGHHFKHYGQFNPACFPNTEVQTFVISEELAGMATAFGIDLGILLESRKHFAFLSDNRDLRDDERLRLESEQ